MLIQLTISETMIGSHIYHDMSDATIKKTIFTIKNTIFTIFTIKTRYPGGGKMSAMGSDSSYRPGGASGGINTAEVRRRWHRIPSGCLFLVVPSTFSRPFFLSPSLDPLFTLPLPPSIHPFLPPLCLCLPLTLPWPSLYPPSPSSSSLRMSFQPWSTAPYVSFQPWSTATYRYNRWPLILRTCRRRLFLFFRRRCRCWGNTCQK